MVVKSLGRALTGLLVLPPAAMALGLGDIRLNSSLNAPLDAEIELVGATPEELSSLKTRIASRDTFARYGLDWPAYMGSVNLSPARTADGREVIQLRSSEAITEPFVTLLVEVNWARGRLVREYTMLLDPPVYTPGQSQSAAAPVAAPTTSQGSRGGAIERTAVEASASSPPAAPAADGTTPAAATASAGTYEVRPGDSLSRIAGRLSQGDAAQTRRWMVALYQANPTAFDGNMNLLQSGAILRVPDSAAVARITPAEASAEVRRQHAAWRAAAPAAESTTESGRLRLVTPSDGTGAAAPGAPAAQAQVQSLRGQVRDLQAELEETKRLLELRNVELAQLQERLAAQTATGPAPAVTEPPSAVEGDAAVPGDTGADIAAAQDPAGTPPADEPAAAEPAAPSEAAPAVAAQPTPTADAASAAEPESSLLDTLKSLWWVLALAIVALLGLLGVRVWRSRRQSQFDDSLGRLASAGAAAAGGAEPALSRTGTFATTAVPREENFLVEESGTHERPAFDEASVAAARNVPTDDTISSETAINLDQGDPLAEADFHMAYGLYDQAADLVRIAVAREPERRDLKLKLLEVFFVWGNKEQFLQAARELAETRSAAAPGEWEKIVIMGKQLAPDDPMFAGGAGLGAAAAGGVDLDLDGGSGRVDFDLLGEPIPAETPDAVDLDIGTALGETAASVTPTDTNLAFDGSTGTSATTRQMTQVRHADDEDLLPDFGAESLDAPTVEQPALDGQQNPTIRQKVERALRQTPGTDQTAELAIDDLGLDLGPFEATDAPGLSSSSDAPTLVAGLDERSRRIMEEAERRAGETETGPTASGSWQFDADDLEPTMPPSSVRQLEQPGHPAEPEEAEEATDFSATTRLGSLKDADIDFDLNDVAVDADAAPNGSGSAADLDLDIGTATVPDVAFNATQKIAADDLALPDLEPVTMSEVGTKLDLARAYMDMGDPEGARNILEEVVQEGTVAQKQEAQRLIASLPG